MNLLRKFKTFDELLPLFLADIKIQLKHKSYLTYTGQTKVFSTWLAENNLSNHRMRTIDSQTMADFFSYLVTERKLDKPTCQKYHLTLRSIWRFAIKRDEVDKEPFELITYPKKGDDCSSEVIKPDDMKILIDEIKVKDKQLYLACMMQFYCFIRPGTELRLMKVADVDLDNGTIQVIQDHAKNGHKRVVTMPTQLIEICKEQGVDKADKSLFVFGKHKRPDVTPCSVNMLRYRFNKFRDKYGMSKGYHLYSLKCSGASMLHKTNNVSMLELMQQLGHSHISATAHYLKRIGGVVNVTIRDKFPDPY
jgi:integrase